MSKFRVCRSRNFEFELEISSWDVEISSLPKSKFRVLTQNFQLGCRNFQFAEVEISSLNSKFPVGMSKFPVCRSRNFQFGSQNFQFAMIEFFNHGTQWGASCPLSPTLLLDLRLEARYTFAPFGGHMVVLLLRARAYGQEHRDSPRRAVEVPMLHQVLSLAAFKLWFPPDPKEEVFIVFEPKRVDSLLYTMIF